MTTDVLLMVLAALTLGAAFGAVPLSAIASLVSMPRRCLGVAPCHAVPMNFDFVAADPECGRVIAFPKQFRSPVSAPLH